MAFKLTYRDGQEDDYDDSTAWAVEDGVLKMGHEAGKWTVLVSPSHWATIEVQPEKSSDDQKQHDSKRDEDAKSAEKKRGDEKDSDKDSDEEDSEESDKD
jgi:hypothetical protein